MWVSPRLSPSPSFRARSGSRLSYIEDRRQGEAANVPANRTKTTGILPRPAYLNSGRLHKSGLKPVARAARLTPSRPGCTLASRRDDGPEIQSGIDRDTNRGRTKVAYEDQVFAASWLHPRLIARKLRLRSGISFVIPRVIAKSFADIRKLVHRTRKTDNS